MAAPRPTVVYASARQGFDGYEKQSYYYYSGGSGNKGPGRLEEGTTSGYYLRRAQGQGGGETPPGVR